MGSSYKQVGKVAATVSFFFFQILILKIQYLAARNENKKWERERGSILSSRPIGKSFNLGLWAPATSALVKVHATAPFFFFQMLILKIQCLAASHKKPNLFLHPWSTWTLSVTLDLQLNSSPFYRLLIKIPQKG